MIAVVLILSQNPWPWTQWNQNHCTIYIVKKGQTQYYYNIIIIMMLLSEIH